ncbi:Uma2 family endonuclease [Catalinimonas alkaloidigena]|uniref:Uma2 family endonuclease n=1 Tax=Catalinimonas alkaloidigena TaxID=1075417 RepID=UPI002405499C|nr:Uma2 family endonuclease [Catalinimonas alkaloidigena]MDF9796188.1 Uma2 family endonuclease [Catalinimonas alkaloidigena]
MEALVGMLEDEFFRFCQDNDHLRIEREATGKIIIKSPTGSKSGYRSLNLNVQLGI